MGSGKSYTGRRLSEALDIPFVDLDNWIETQEGQSIKTIFEKSGEAAFRHIEWEALHQMIEYGQAIIACGGGAPCFFDNMEWMNRHGITVYLQTPVDELCRGLLTEMAHRPLLKGLDEQTLPGFIEEKLALREPYYLQSQVVSTLPAALEEMLVALKAQMVTGY